MYDAVAASADELANHGRLSKQVLLVITDGADNASRLDLEQAIRRVQNLGGPVVYTSDYFSEPIRPRRSTQELLWRGFRRRREVSLTFPIPYRMWIASRRRSHEDIREQYTIGYHSTRAVSLGVTGLCTSRRAQRSTASWCEDAQGYYAKRPTPQRTQTVQEAKQ